ncbi:MAG: hypothetical protein LBK73_12235 [Treponema sp.]|jgi:hypothetical protein|nr:hypothetical protein [Treponema sp.]
MSNLDNEWRERIEERIGIIESRLSIMVLEKEPAVVLSECIHLKLELPEADIGGLHFNKTEVETVFDLKEDGLYYSRDILFISARGMDEGTGRDLLTEYLESAEFRLSLAEAIFECRNALTEKYGDMVSLADCLEVSLPEENQGVKKYNGVTCGYWLRPRYCGSTDGFCIVNYCGDTYGSGGAHTDGCAPAFRVRAAGGNE